MISEELCDAPMSFSKLTAVTLIKDKDDMFLFEIFHSREIALLTDSGVEFLDGGDYETGVVVKLFYKSVGIISSVHTPCAETIELFCRLVIEVFSINDKDYFMNIGKFHQNLSCLKRGESFS